MKYLSIFFALAFLVVSCDSAQAATAPKPSASFTVGVTHVDKYTHDTKAPALILIPGLTDSAAVWNGTIAHFAPAHTIYALTLSGFGATTPAAAPLIDKAVADIAVLIAREHLNKPVVIGHSLGGFTAIRVAEEHGDLLRGAIAVDGLPVFPGMDTMTAQQRAANAAQTASIFTHITAEQLYEGSKTYSIRYLTEPQNIDTVVTFGKGADPMATAEYMTEMVSADLRPALANVKIPLLEIGPFDAKVDPHNPTLPTTSLAQKQAYYEKLLSADPTAKVQMIDNSMHFVMIDQPAPFYAAVSAFLRTLP